MLLASIRERQREIQLLRVVGAPPLFLFLLVELEALLISVVSILFGAAILYLSLITVSDVLAADFGLNISANILSKNNLFLILLVILSTIIAAAIPSLKAYKSASIM